LRTLLPVVFGILAVTTPAASAQSAGSLAATLSKNAPCEAPDARAALQHSVEETDAAAVDVLAALSVIAADTGACAPLRDAAQEIAGALAPPAAKQIPAVASTLVADTQAEAERRASMMKFEVGPPPPRLTGGGFPGL